MPQKSGFFDSTSDDPRLYPAREFAEYFARFIGNGIYGGGTNLKVSAAGTDNKVSIATGYAWINGYLYSIFSEPLSLTLTPATTLDRIDRIVLRLNVSTPVRAIRATIVQGTPGTSPVAPALTRSGDIYDISLAQVRLTAGSAIVLPHQVTDERLNNAVCGVVTGLIEQANTTSIFNEFQSWLTIKKAEYQQAIDNVPIVGITSRNVHLEDLEGNFVSEDLEGAMQELFTNVSNGKLLVAGAITDKGVPANPSDTFIQLAAKIIQIIKASGTAQPADVLVGKPFSNVSGSAVGSMPNRTFAYSGGYTPAAGRLADGGGALTVIPQTGYYLEERNGSSFGPIIIVDSNFIAANIPEDLSIFGLQGALKRGSKVAYGTIEGVSGGTITVSGIGFQPSRILISGRQRFTNGRYAIAWDYTGDSGYNTFSLRADTVGSISAGARPVVVSVNSNGFVIPDTHFGLDATGYYVAIS